LARLLANRLSRETDAIRLMESEARYRGVFENSHAAMLIINPANGAIADANPAACRFYGWSQAELRRMEIGQINTLPGGQVRASLDQARKQLAGAFQFSHRRADGSVREVEVFSGPVTIDRQEFLFSIVHDVTDRQRADTALRHSEQLLRHFVEHAPVALAMFDREMRYIRVSRRWLTEYHLGDHDLRGRSHYEIFPEITAEWQEIHRRGMAGEIMRAEEDCFRRADGTTQWLRWEVRPWQDTAGEVGGIIVFSEDITARKRAEAALLKSEAQFAAAFDLSPLAANLVALDTGRIVKVNELYCQLFGYTRDEVIGRTVPELNMWVEPARRDELMARVRSESSVRDYEARLRRKNGEIRDVLISVKRTDDPGIAEPLFVSMLSDVTERKSSERQLLQTQRMEAMGTLAGGIAHDLNNILTPMLMVAGMLKTKLNDEQEQEMLGLLEREAKRGGEIIRQLLAFGRGLEGKHAIIQPRYILREILMLLRETFPRELVLNQQWPAELWPVSADQTQLHQVVLNLCVNARDAMPTGGQLTIAAANVTLSAAEVSRCPTALPGSYVLIEVQDTGTGISPEVLPRIFEPFFTTKALGKGTGLGLSTVLGIVQNHGGFVTVDSVPGQGSTFKTYWPAAPSAVATGGVEVRTTVPEGKGELVLVVDDEPNIREATRIALQANGYRVQLAVNGEDALVHYHRLRSEVRLVITDLMMPVMNGIRLVRRLRELEPELPVVATSGLTDADMRSELASLGVSELLMKPSSVADLVAAVQRSLVEATRSKRA
jgi:PAS domain S-box-containing protein